MCEYCNRGLDYQGYDWMRLLLITILGVFFTAPLFASKVSPLKWGYINFQPYHFNDKDKVEGEIVDAVDQIFNKAQLRFSPIQLPNKRAKLYLEQGRVDFTIVIESYVNQPDNYLRSKRPFYLIKLGAVCRYKSNTIKSIDDLKGIRLILLTGYSYGLDFELDKQRGFDVVLKAQNHTQALSALEYDRGDCALGYKGPFQSEDYEQNKLNLHFYPMDEFPVYLYLNKQVANADDVMKRINNAMQ